MIVVSIVSAKGGVGRTTTAANLGGLAADAGLRVLLVDLDLQPTLSRYYPLRVRAPSGVYELLAFADQRTEQLVSQTSITNMDIILANDDRGQLSTLLLQAPDGRLRLRNLLTQFAPLYDLLIVDTQGSRSVLLEAALLASDIAVSPVTPEILAARGLRRGTIQLMQDIEPLRHLGINLPVLRLLVNRVHPVSANARLIRQAVRELFDDQKRITVLETDVPAIEAYRRASTLALPVHRVESRRPSGRVAPAAAETMRALATELFPQWRTRFAQLVRKMEDGRGHGGSA